MADGTIRIKLEAAAAAAEADRIKKSLIDVDSAAQKTNQSVSDLEKTVSKTKQNVAQATQSVSALSGGMTALSGHTKNTEVTLEKLNQNIRLFTDNQIRLNTAIEQARSGTSQTTTVMKAATIQTESASVASKQLEKDYRSLESTGRSLNSVLAGIGSALTLSYAFQTLTDFERALAAVRAVTMATAEQFSVLRDKAQEMGATTIYTAGQAADGMKFLAQSGFSTGEILDSVSSVLALAQSGSMGLAEASEIAAKALRGFRLEASQMNQVADIMAQTAASSTTSISELGYAYKYVAAISSSLKVNIAEASAAIGVLSDAGIDATMAGTALRRIMSELSNPTIKATKLLASFGLTMDDVDIKARGLFPVLQTLKDAGLTVGEIFALFGDRGAPGFETLAANLDTVRKRYDELMNSGGRVLEMQKIMDESLYGDIYRLISAMEYFITQGAKDSGLLEGLRTVINGLADGVRWLTQNSEILIPVLTALGTAVVSKIGQLTLSLANLGPVAVTSLSSVAASLTRVNVALIATQSATVAAKAGMTLFTRSLALVGGVPGAALMGLSYLLYEITSHETAADKAAKEYATTLDTMKDSSKEAGDSLKSLQERLRGMSEVKLKLKLEETQDLERDLRQQLLSMDLRSIEVFDTSRLFPPSREQSEAITKLNELRKQYIQGSIDLKTFKDRTTDVAAALNDVSTYKVVAAMQDLAEKLNLTRDDVTLTQLTVDGLNDSLNMLGATAKDTGKKLKDIFPNAGNMLQLVSDYRFEIDKLSQDKSVRNLMTAIREEVGDSWDKMKIDWKTGAITVTDANYTVGESVRQTVKELVQLNQQVEKMKQDEKDAANASKTYGKSLREVSAELDRLLMTDKEAAKMETVRKLAELEKALGSTHPKVVQFRTEMEKAFAAGFTSPKDVMKARSEFLKEFEQFSMGDTNYKIAEVEKRADALQILFQGEAENLARIEQWKNSKIQKIQLEGKNKQLDIQKQFWSEYMAMTGNGYVQNEQALTASLNSQAEIYRVAGIEEAAIAEWAEGKRLQASLSASDGIERSLMALSARYKDEATMWADVVTTTMDTATDLVTNWIVKGEADFRAFVQNVAAMLMKLAIQAMVLKPIFSFFGFADGGVFSGGGLVPFASGGVVTSPTLFPMTGRRTGVMGEAGPEAIMPLTRMPSGRLGVESTGTGNSYVNITQNMSFVVENNSGMSAQGSISEDTAKYISKQVQYATLQAVDAYLRKEKRVGGQLSRFGGA